MGQHRTLLAMCCTDMSTGALSAQVHNAGTCPHIDLLTVNLEHDLRATISALFNIVVIHPTVSTAEEAFTRCQFTTGAVFRELNPLYGITEKKVVTAIEKQLKEGAFP
ncbi:hypothetical protein DF41_17630 [Raoultella planticola]|nr:hypothetical protein [Raoultella planticola]KAJ95764.1 hypothetical protein DF41_17630 [Raoultella planticola]